MSAALPYKERWQHPERRWQPIRRNGFLWPPELIDGDGTQFNGAEMELAKGFKVTIIGVNRGSKAPNAWRISEQVRAALAGRYDMRSAEQTCEAIDRVNVLTIRDQEHRTWDFQLLYRMANAFHLVPFLVHGRRDRRWYLIPNLEQLHAADAAVRLGATRIPRFK